MSMSFDLPKAAIDQLQGFITLLKAKPEILHKPELKFFLDYLESLGANIPPAPAKQEATPEPTTRKTEEVPPGEEKDDAEASIYRILIF